MSQPMQLNRLMLFVRLFVCFKHEVFLLGGLLLPLDGSMAGYSSNIILIQVSLAIFWYSWTDGTARVKCQDCPRLSLVAWSLSRFPYSSSMGC